MRTCPNCSNIVNRLKKGGCPVCGTPIFLLRGKYRKTSDRDIVRQFLLRLDENYATQHSLSSVSVFSKSTAAWSGAYHLLDLTHSFVRAQKHIYEMGEANLFFDALEAVLAEKWWAERVSTVQMLYNKWNAVLPKVLLRYRQAHEQEIIQTRKRDSTYGRILESAVPAI